MANSSGIKTKGKNILLYRGYTPNGSLSATEYLPPSKFKIGIGNGTQNIADTDLDEPVPISDGTTYDAGSNNFTGSSGGDNSTDNTSTYKEGAGNTDATAQNLIANGTSTSKIWTLTPLTANIVASNYVSHWLYIKDSTTLDKFATSSCFNIQFRTNGDAANLGYEITKDRADLAVGWNLISSKSTIVSDLTQLAGGPPSGNIDEIIITITTTVATSTFVAEDVVYDLLRGWADSDLIKDFVSGYPTFDYINNIVTTRCAITTVELNGFFFNSLGIFNEDTTPLMTSGDTFDGDSKTSTDEFYFQVKDRVI